MVKKLTLALSLFIHCIQLCAQNPKVDSLFNELNAQQDTFKVNTLLALSKEFKSLDVEKAIEYSIQANELAAELNFLKGKIENLYNLGSLYLNHGKNELSIQHFKEGLNEAENYGDPYFISKGYYLTANYLITTNKLKEARNFIDHSLEIANANDFQKLISLNYRKLGRIHQKSSDYVTSLDYHFKSIKIEESHNDQAGVASVVSVSSVSNDSMVMAQKSEDHMQNLMNNEDLFYKSIQSLKDGFIKRGYDIESNPALKKLLTDTEYQSEILKRSKN